MVRTSFAPQEFPLWLLSVQRTIFTNKSSTFLSTVKTATDFSLQQKL